MDNFTSKERAVNFSACEKNRFLSLIEKYKDILFSKKTDNINNLKKNKTWAAIHAEFNAGGDKPRTLRQLKARFDNMKRNARKDASQERQARVRTGGGPTPPPVHPETEWFRSVMPVSMDGLPSVVDDDLIETQLEVSYLYDSQEVNHLSQTITGNVQADDTSNISEGIISAIETTVKDVVFDTKSPASLLRKPVSKPLRIRKRSYSKNVQELKSEILGKIKEQEDNIYRLRIKHMKEKRKEEKELYELQKKKLTYIINKFIRK